MRSRRRRRRRRRGGVAAAILRLAAAMVDDVDVDAMPVVVADVDDGGVEW